MSIKKLKKMYCRAIGVETFRKAVLVTLIGFGEYVFFMWIVFDWIQTIVTRGY